MIVIVLEWPVTEPEKMIALDRLERQCAGS
jgi:hypothetical protein